MSDQVNFVIDDDNWQHLSAVPRGERSRGVNQALSEYRRVQNRRAAADRMGAISRCLSVVEGHAEHGVRANRERDG